MQRELWELHIIIIEPLTWKNGHICPEEIMRKKKFKVGPNKDDHKKNPRKLQAKVIRELITSL